MSVRRGMNQPNRWERAAAMRVSEIRMRFFTDVPERLAPRPGPVARECTADRWSRAPRLRASRGAEGIDFLREAAKVGRWGGQTEPADRGGGGGRSRC